MNTSEKKRLIEMRFDVAGSEWSQVSFSCADTIGTISYLHCCDRIIRHDCNLYTPLHCLLFYRIKPFEIDSIDDFALRIRSKGPSPLPDKYAQVFSVLNIDCRYEYGLT